VTVATVLAWAGWLGLITAMISDFSLLAPKSDGLLWTMQIVGALVFLGGTLAGLLSAVHTLRSGRPVLAKIWAVGLALALLVSLWVAFAFHLLSFGVKY
jgi:hypothetical protein